MIAHISLAVKDFQKSTDFYDKSLAILGYKRVMDFEDPITKISWAGYGKENDPCFWLTSGGNSEEQIGNARGLHVCFNATSIENIKEWHQKCIELGGLDNGAPGKRVEYEPNYYAGFIIDPNGWRIEAFINSAY